MQSYPLPLEMLFRWEREKPDEVYLRQPVNGKWKEWTWKETAGEVRSMAAWLKQRNLPAGSNIAMISKNCAHWIITDLAIMMSGHTSIPLYPNLNAETIRQILEHSESKVLFVGKLDNWEDMKAGVPEGVQCISFPFYPHPEYPQWYDLLQSVEPVREDITRNPDELATIIYTSGTTGKPKGVMHKFYNFAFAISNALTVIDMQEAHFFSYLPLCHIAERFLVEMGSLYTGGTVAFAESIDTFAANLAEVQPTVFLGVPRIWTKFQEGVFQKMPPEKLDLYLKIPILSTIVKKKIKKALGLSRAKHIFTGAAPTPASLLEWYKKLDIHIQEAYAMTENCCYSHVTLPDNIKIGFVGKALPKVKVKLSEQNEILIRHEALMDGYYKEPELTARAFEDGYLKTGDEGWIDEEGFLKITGRVKDIFKTAKGKYVAPAPIELKVEANPDIAQVCVVGTNLPQPIALVVLSDKGKQKTDAEIEKSLSQTLKEVNQSVDPHEMLKKIVIVDEEWTVENNFLTPSMKIKRNVIEKTFMDRYQQWYDAPETIIREKQAITA